MTFRFLIPTKPSIQRACTVLRAERSSYHYRGKGTDQADLKQRIKEIAETRVRYDCRRIHVLLQREGWVITGRRVYRLYKEMDLQLRKKAPKRRVKAKLREGRCAASRVNDMWAMELPPLGCCLRPVDDQLATEPKLRVLTVVDTFSRHSPAVVPLFRFRAPGCDRRARKGVCRGRESGLDPGRIGQRVHLPRDGFAAIHKRSDARLLPAWRANGQCAYRLLERQVPAGMP